MALLEVRGLVKYYGKRKVVDGVSFEVNAGEVVGLLGGNGAGKTTSFRMTTGQIEPFDGQVMFNGEDVTALPMYQRARRGMGYLTQEQSIFRKLSVEKNILAILEALPRSRSLGRRLTKAERVARTEEVLGRFNLKHVRHNISARASGGEKRRLEIARCLVCEPMLILLDEPFAAVDPKTTEDIRQNIRELAQQGIGILLTDHNVREVLKITDRSYLIAAGQVVTAGTPQQLIRDPIAIREYLGSSFTDNSFGDGVGAARPRPAEAVPMAEPVADLEGNSRDGYVLPPPKMWPAGVSETSPSISMDEILKLERVGRLVEMLRYQTTQRAAIEELAAMGQPAVGPLLEALDRDEVEIRHNAKELLQFLLKRPLAFNASAPADERRVQAMVLRNSLGAARAG